MRHKVGLYVRVSTEEQAQVIEGSIESQKHRLAGFVDLKNMQDLGWGKVVETYTDEGLSAKDTRRPAFQRMMRDVRAGKINLILVTDLSRLSRNILDFCILLEDLKKASAKFLSLKEQFDTTTAAGEMMVFNMINLAQFERRQTSERVAMNFHARALRGLRNGGNVLLGYEVDPTNPGRYVIRPDEAAQVRRIFAIYREECSISKTIKRVTDEGIRPKCQPSRRNQHNMVGRWTYATMSNVLRSYAYAALREINAQNKEKDQESLRQYERYQVVKASWEQIIEPPEFHAVQRVLDENAARERKRHAAYSDRTFLLSGMIYCQECGRPLVGSSGHGRLRVHRYYIHRKVPGVPVTCRLKTINAEQIEQRVLEHLDDVLTREGYLDQIEHRLDVAYSQDQGDLRTRLVNYEAELARTGREIRSTLRLIAEMSEDGMDVLLKENLRTLKDQKIEAERQLDEMRHQLSEAQSAQADRKVIEFKIEEVRKLKTKANPAMLKRLLRGLISAIVISADGASLGYWRTDAEKKKAPDQKSGAAFSHPFETSTGRRWLEKIQVLSNLPALPGQPINEAVQGGYVLKSGEP